MPVTASTKARGSAVVTGVSDDMAGISCKQGKDVSHRWYDWSQMNVRV